MAKKNTGKKFEKLAESIYKKLIKNPVYEKVEHNVSMQGIDGARQVDVLISSEIFGEKMKIAIECKDHKDKISVGTLDAFHSKLMDLKINKGILISKKGFSSKSISKAKRLGITLCTAHEALSPNWTPEMDIPVLISEVRANKLNFEINISTNSNEDNIPKSAFLEINGINIPELITQKWKNNTLSYKLQNGSQEIIIEELKSPLIVKFGPNKGYSKTINYIKFFLSLKIKYYQTSLGQLKGTQILQNITNKETTVFFNIYSIAEAFENLNHVKEKDTPNFIGLTFKALVSPQFDTIPKNLKIMDKN